MNYLPPTWITNITTLTTEFINSSICPESLQHAEPAESWRHARLLKAELQFHQPDAT